MADQRPLKQTAYRVMAAVGLRDGAEGYGRSEAIETCRSAYCLSSSVRSGAEGYGRSEAIETLASGSSVRMRRLSAQRGMADQRPLKLDHLGAIR